MPLLVGLLDPRRSLVAAIGWLVFVLSFGLAMFASIWVDRIVGDDLLELRGQQMSRTAERLGAELNLGIELRLQSVRSLGAILATEFHEDSQVPLQRLLDNQRQAYPEFASVVFANSNGRVMAATGGFPTGSSVSNQTWFAEGLKSARSGMVRSTQEVLTVGVDESGGHSESVIQLIVPVVEGNRVVGVIGTQMNRHWLLEMARDLVQELRGVTGTEALLLNSEGSMLIGPNALMKQEQSLVSSHRVVADPVNAGVDDLSAQAAAQLRLMADGNRYLVAQAHSRAFIALNTLGWHVLLIQPMKDAMKPVKILQGQITMALLGLGLVSALLGVWLTRRVTRGLEVIARSADDVRSGVAQQILIPAGSNEPARLGRVLSDLLTSLQRERVALQTLNAELDHRVIERTREIERLAKQSRHAAVIRERLRIARDLHDTLAHSMMAMLTEVRLLKRLSISDPQALTQELVHAEEAAHEGLREARAAIAHMRINPVRDNGLAAALDDLVHFFIDRTGIQVQYTSNAQPGAYADERAETVYRIAEESLRNIERHAGASLVAISLTVEPELRKVTFEISDNGIGFDTTVPHPGHYGLAGLREQSQLIGASMDIRSVLRQGTTIHLTVTGFDM